jgi:hypothetical protein
MSFGSTQREVLRGSHLQGIGSSMSTQNAAVAAPQRRRWFPRPPVRYSQLTAAQMYQVARAQRIAIREMFVNTLGTSAGSYAAIEAANATAAGLISGGY